MMNCLFVENKKMIQGIGFTEENIVFPRPKIQKNSLINKSGTNSSSIKRKSHGNQNQNQNQSEYLFSLNTQQQLDDSTALHYFI